VYGTLGAEGLFTEKTPYAPNSPYSATKAGSDHLVRAYHHTYKMDTVITNCSNNYGPHQHDEKLIPTVIRKALAHQPIPVYGKGENVRDWLFVEDHCKAIDIVFHHGRSGESYNVGGRNEWKNIDLVRRICALLNEIAGNGPGGDYANLITFVTDRPGHDLRYAIDATKLETELGWRNTQDFNADLKKTVTWFVNKYQKGS
jgi:dTDP-glucose 4,6-dehydratase